MKTIRQYIKLVIIVLMAEACATPPTTIPEKYNLDDQLENVSNIYRYNLIDWDRVDNQSFILQTGPSDYYLIVLEQKTNAFAFPSSIKISNTESLFWPGYANVIVNNDGWEDSYEINKIYRLQNCEQAETIRAHLGR